MLTDPDVQILADGVAEVLEKVGIMCQNREILEAVDKAGARVDHSRETATFPRHMTEAFVEQVKEESPSVTDVEPEFGQPSLAIIETQVAQFFYDCEKKERRSGNKKDFIELIKFGDMLHPDTQVGHALLLTDVPPMLEPLEAAMLLAEYAHKPGPAFAWNVRQVDYLVEMGEILGLHNWFTWGATCFAHPLRFDRDVADKFVRLVRGGGEAGLTAMPVAGMTTPVTVAGFVVMVSAELVATWLAGRALNSKAPLGGRIWGGTMDMKTGEVSYCSFDSMFYAFAASEFMRRWTGQIIPVGGGEYCDAKVPGYYAALEKAYKAMTIAAFTGQSFDIGQGMLEEGKTISPVQLLLEREFGLGLQILGRHVEATAENIALDSIFEVGFGLTKSYLNIDHTLHHYRQSLWCPQLMERSGWEGFEKEGVVLKRLQGKVNELISSYQKPEVDPARLAAMRQIVERARRELS
jgi:trimethylamine--corrinoid protein Co-methyltransferase